MKKATLYTFIGLSFFLSFKISGQALQEKLRAEFLTKYYADYQNKLQGNTGIDTVQTSRINAIDNSLNRERTRVNPNVDSLMRAKKIENISANCLNSLYNENKGVVESAIYVSIQFKNKFPNENVSTFVEALERIIKGNDDARIRYKAQLAKMYINNIDWFENLEVNSIEYEKEVYLSIAQTLSGKLFSQDF
jgi:hypothetical protein